MSTTKKILVLWGTYLLLSFLSLMFPHHYVDKTVWVNTNLQVLLLIICLYMIRKSTKKNRPVFINFVVLFFSTFLAFNFIFVGTVFWKDSPYAIIVYHTLVGKIGAYFVLAVSLVYLSIDYFFDKLAISRKYLLTLSITIVVFIALFRPYALDPLSLYQTDEYSKYLRIKSAYTTLLGQSKSEPTNLEIQQMLQASAAQEISATEVEQFRAYLVDGAETSLFWKPLNTKLIYVDFFLAILLGLFVVHKYWNDKPHPAYLEKIAILFILWCGFDAFHYIVFINTASLELYRTLFTIGQYLSIITVLLMVYVFSVRLRFVLSPSGQYYEEELLLHPQSVTRWRDEIDTLILNSFFSSKRLIGRLIMATPTKNAARQPSSKNI